MEGVLRGRWRKEEISSHGKLGIVDVTSLPPTLLSPHSGNIIPLLYCFETQFSWEIIPHSSPKWLDQPSVSGGVRSSALSFPGNCDWPRDGHVMHSGPMRCNEAVVVASGGLADSLSVLSQRQEILGMDLSGEGGAQRPGDTRQDLVTSSKPLDPVVPETKYSLHFVVT